VIPCLRDSLDEAIVLLIIEVLSNIFFRHIREDSRYVSFNADVLQIKEGFVVISIFAINLSIFVILLLVNIRAEIRQDVSYCDLSGLVVSHSARCFVRNDCLSEVFCKLYLVFRSSAVNLP
jgi:hypothetical protein